MKEWLTFATEHIIMVIDALATVIVVYATLEAFIAVCTHFAFATRGHEGRVIWLRYARWLVAALTFQLAADIIESSITTSWENVARLAAIAVIRTFLNYFLESDVAEIRERDHERKQ